MIPIASGVRIWLATGHTDMRRGMRSLALQVQEGLGRDPFAGDVFFFRGRSGSLIKAIWHDGLGLSLYAKRLDRGRFVWPQTVDGVVSLTMGQASYYSKESIGEIRNKHGVRKRPDEPIKFVRTIRHGWDTPALCDSLLAWTMTLQICRTISLR